MRKIRFSGEGSGLSLEDLIWVRVAPCCQNCAQCHCATSLFRGGFRGVMGAHDPTSSMLRIKIFENRCDTLIITHDVLIIMRDVSVVHAHAGQHTHNNNSILMNK